MFASRISRLQTSAEEWLRECDPVAVAYVQNYLGSPLRRPTRLSPLNPFLRVKQAGDDGQ